MRTVIARGGAAAALLSSLAVVGAFATASYAAETGTVCASNSGSIKLSPGLAAPGVESAKVQNITIKGVLSGCTGSTVTEGKYLAHLKTSGPVDCSVLSTGELATGSVVIKWKPKGTGNSHGTMTMVLKAGATTLGGKLETPGPLENRGIYRPITESFGACPNGTKPLKAGTFSGSQIRFSGPPKATISSPASGGIYVQGAVVPTSFSCAESTFGPGLESCEDSNGSTSGTGALETATLGEHAYSVTAKSIDGQKGKASVHYEVIE